uniref:Uncharacterized protein n=1 Tax=Pseudomonas fluorescens (strain SBW25) TaxID=216595 RepID=A0A0G4E567_PSEFS|nr:hypothetical protein PQBR57_0139 [Pseudomonas fluorescens SBW25]
MLVLLALIAEACYLPEIIGLLVDRSAEIADAASHPTEAALHVMVFWVATVAFGFLLNLMGLLALGICIVMCYDLDQDQHLPIAVTTTKVEG